MFFATIGVHQSLGSLLFPRLWQELDKCWGWFKMRLWREMLYLHWAILWGMEISQLAGRLGCKGGWNGDLVKPTVSTSLISMGLHFFFCVVVFEVLQNVFAAESKPGSCQLLPLTCLLLPLGQWGPCQGFLFSAAGMNAVKLRGEAEAACCQEAAAQLHQNNISSGCVSPGRPTSPWMGAGIDPTQHLAFTGSTSMRIWVALGSLYC